MRIVPSAAAYRPIPMPMPSFQMGATSGKRTGFNGAGIRTDADAEAYIRDAIWTPHQTCSHGMFVIERRSGGIPIGICGLVKRDFLPAPDLGFALLPAHVGQGYAFEASLAVLAEADAQGMEKIFAFAIPGNRRSLRLLERLGFRHEGRHALPDGADVELVARYRDPGTLSPGP